MNTTYNIRDMHSLRLAIQDLEVQKKNQAADLKEQMHTTLESLRPSNIIRSTFKELVQSPDVREGLLKSSLLLLASKALPGGGITRALMRNVLGWGSDRLTSRDEILEKKPLEVLANKARHLIKGFFQKKNGQPK